MCLCRKTLFTTNSRREEGSITRRKALVFRQPVAVEGVADDAPPVEQMHRRRERFWRRRARRREERGRHEHGAELVVHAANGRAARRTPSALEMPRRAVRRRRAGHDDVCRSEAGFERERRAVHRATRVAMAVRGRVRRRY